MIFLDTCILIDYLKSNEKIKCFIDSQSKDNFGLNSIVLMELYKGALNKKELLKIKKELIYFRLLEINQDLMNLATNLIESYSLSHNLKVQDAIIAASSLIYDIKLFTYNIKDFSYIPEIKIYKIT